MSYFSNELIQRIIKYFKEKHSLNISEEKADEYLNSLAIFFSSFFEEKSP